MLIIDDSLRAVGWSFVSDSVLVFCPGKAHCPLLPSTSTPKPTAAPIATSTPPNWRSAKENPFASSLNEEDVFVVDYKGKRTALLAENTPIISNLREVTTKT